MILWPSTRDFLYRQDDVCIWIKAQKPDNLSIHIVIMLWLGNLLFFIVCCWFLALFIIRDLLLINSLSPSDTIWCRRSWSTLAQVMAWCLTAPSHYLSHCWIIIAGICGIFRRAISLENVKIIEFENDIFESTSTSPRGQWVNDPHCPVLSLFCCVKMIEYNYVPSTLDVFCFLLLVQLWKTDSGHSFKLLWNCCILTHWPLVTPKSKGSSLYMYFTSLVRLWFNTDCIWQHRSGSALMQLMAHCLTAPSHHLRQCWLVINEVQWHLPQGSYTGNSQNVSHQKV